MKRIMTGTGVSVGTGDGTPGRVLMALMTMNRPLMDINRCHNSLRQVQIIQKPVKDSRDSHQLEVHQLLQHDLQFMLHHQGALRRMREQWNLHQL
jgi:hypothetical protein